MMSANMKCKERKLFGVSLLSITSVVVVSHVPRPHLCWFGYYLAHVDLHLDVRYMKQWRNVELHVNVKVVVFLSS